MAKKVPDLNQVVSKIDQLLEKQKKLIVKLNPIQEQLSKVYKQLTELQEQRDTLILVSRKDPEEIDINLVLMGDAKTTVMHNEQERQTKKLGLHSSGYWSDTNQRCINICLIRGDKAKTKQTYDSLMLLLPHIIPVVPERSDVKDLIKRIGIFEHTCSANGVYSLYVHEDNSVTLVCRTYSIERILKKFPNLMEALEHCEASLWYEKAEPLSYEQRDVHTEHCCLTHGCKYGKDDNECTVTTGRKPQSFDCEYCRDDDDDDDDF